MITINHTKLQKVITGYKKYFPSHIGDEIYKWKAVKHFQDYWDIDAPNFIEMFWEATATFDNLLSSRNHYPRAMVRVMCESEPDTIRAMFRDLFDESKPIEARVNKFRAEADRIRNQYWPDKMHYQDINAISTYLWARYPDKYYIYKYSEIRTTTRALDSSYVVRKGADADGFKLAIEFFDLIRAGVQQDPEIRPMLNAVLTSDCYKDENLNCVVVDMDFYVGRFWEDLTPVQPEAKENAKYWMNNPGENARKWDKCTAEGDGLGDEGVVKDLESNKSASHVTSYEKYSQEDFLEEVYMSKDDLKNLENLLKNKKNVILQGAPGVGKTFCARRLAYELMGEKDESRVSLIQFHQNYSYEDFILGYKPSGSDFELQRGIFYKFCINAANNPDKPHFFIIDEINRGNLSKIFGELLMLIEKDYRGEKLTLAYKDEKFFVPKNVYIIGMMNTADRSLAMIDYALRRRFSFYEMHPGFKSEGFQKYQVAMANPRFDRLIEKIEDLNRAIAKDESLGTGFELGHSYFCGQKSVDDAWLHQVINYDIIPMLQEYWFDNRTEVKKWETELNSIFND